MKKLVMAVVMAGLVLSSGCSMINYNASKKDYVARVATQRAMASGDQQAIRAVANGNYVGVGMDLLDPNLMDVLREHPIRATLAALADVATAAAATYAISGSYSSNDSKTKSVNITTTGNGNINTVTMDNSGSVHNENFAGDQAKGE